MRQEDDQRKSIVQQIQQKSTDFLRRIIAPVGGEGVVSLSFVCSHCHRFSIEDDIWWVSTRHGKKQCRGGYHGCAEEVYRGGQSRGGEDLRPGEELGGNQSCWATSTKKMFPDAAVREVVDDLTRRRGEEGVPHLFINTIHVRKSWEPPLVDEDWHAVCQAIHKGTRERRRKTCTSVWK